MHQTIEHIHRIAIDGKLHTLNKARIRDLFERIFGFLCLSEARTAEERKEDALMVLPYRPERVDAAGKHFDATVRRIQAGEFTVATPPEPRICRECDLRTLCRAEGVIGGEVD